MLISIYLISSAFAFTNGIFYLILRFERESRKVITLNIISLILSASLIIFFLIKMKMGLLAPVLGETICQGILLIILFSLTRKAFAFGILKHELILQFQYGVSCMIIGLACYALAWVDRLFINQYYSLGDVGIYSFGYKLGAIINILFILPFSQIWTPMRMEYRNDQNAGKLYRLMLTYYFLIGLLITVAVSIFTKEFVAIIARRQEYQAASQVVPVIMLSNLMYGAINVLDNGILFSRKVFYSAYIFWLTLIISVVLNYLFVPRYGYMASAYVALTSYISMAIMIFYVSNKLYKVQVQWGRLAKIFISGLFILILGNLPINQGLYATVIFKCLLILILIMLLYYLVLDETEKTSILKLFREQIQYKVLREKQ
jgi:O-antigen/teichoic acid export membrane protein